MFPIKGWNGSVTNSTPEMTSWRPLRKWKVVWNFFCFYFTKTFYAQSILFENDRFSLGTHNNFCNFLFINIFSILALFYQNKWRYRGRQLVDIFLIIFLKFFRNVGVASISQIWRAIQNSVRQSQKDGYHYGTASTEKIFAELSFAISRA